jgi:hypothetical protein
MLPPPRIDSRTSDEVVQQILKLLLPYSGASQTHGEAVFSADKGASGALIEIFGRFAELIIERLNQVPGKNLLAFLDLIGASLLPPQPARAPLTFLLANGSPVDGLVPAGTPVAAVQSEGETAPVIFETEEELVVTAAQLTSLFVRQPDQDKYADYSSSMINSISAEDGPAFLGNRKLEHILYLGHDTVFSDPGLKALTLSFVTRPADKLSPLAVTWEAWNGKDWIALSSVTDATSGLTQSGDVTLSSLSPFPRKSVNGMEKCWLRCRLLTPIPPAAFGQAGKLPELMPVQIKQATFNGTELKPDYAIAHDTPVDTVKGFFPFGEKPKAGDALYLAQTEAFKKRGTTITLKITLANELKTSGVTLAWEFWDGTSWSALTLTPNDGTNSLTKTGDLILTVPGRPAATTINGIESFWIRVRINSGNYGEEAHFALNPTDPTKYLFADADLERKKADKTPDPYYGDPTKGYKLIPANLAPPFINSLTINYSAIQPVPAVTPAASEILSPQVVLTYNDFEYQDVTGAASFNSFQCVTDTRPTLYLGFTLPAGLKTFPNRKISFYAALLEFKSGEDLIPLSPGRSRRLSADPKTTSTVTHNFTVTNPTAQAVVYLCEVAGNSWSASVSAEISVAPGESRDLSVLVTIPNDRKAVTRDSGFLTLTLKSAPASEYTAVFTTDVGDLPASKQPELVWEYSSDATWSNLTVRDYSANLTKPGLIEFLAPPDFDESSEFGLQRYWLRATWASGEYLFDPRLRGLLLNTTMGTQAVTINDEVLGSSSQTASQLFHTIRAPILAGPQLYVREPELPPANERAKLENEQAEPALQAVMDATGRPKEIWVRWDQTPDFYGSGPRDRHYVLDNLTGEVRFGDGQNGLIPPAGIGNIRMSRYRTGGGAIGNKPTGAITQLKTTVPYVQTVVNYLPASGGSDSETTDSLLQRAPRSLRHGDRAVTVKDYEDLALLASTEVARARCVPLTNLISDGNASDGNLIKNGTLSLIIVPRSTEAKSSPSLGLIGRVQEFIGRRQNPLADLIVTGPEYLGIDVRVDVTPKSFDGAKDLKLVIERTISGYLHPLTGGMDGAGWDFGRYPHESNLYALIEALPGVDHVKSLKLTPDLDSAEVDKAGEYFLVYSGTHSINLKL